jgi:hypothetical protein
MRWAWDRKEMHIIFWLENLEGRDHLKSRRRWEDNIRMDLREIEWNGVE